MSEQPFNRTSPDQPDEAALSPDAPCFVIVTPAYNSETYLDETILSVVSQVGGFDLFYHIQDGGSTDGTLDLVRRWERLLKGGDFPVGCRSLRFSFASAPDGGMYQAINRGFAAVRPAGPSIMSWINSDDRLAPGALATIEAAYAMFPAVAFTCARISLMDERGSVMGVNLPDVYGRAALARGEHDGRTRNFVMQEGTFWRSSLWDKVGGLDERFRLAGDWDLWRRFAEHADLVTVDTILGFHRRRPGQLTSEMGRYYAEVDAGLADRGDKAPPIDEGVTGDVIRFDVGLQKPVLFPEYGRTLTVPISQGQNGIRLKTARVELLAGARRPEGPFPELSLPSGIRAVDSTVLNARVRAPFPGAWTMILAVRSWRWLRIRVWVGEGVCHDAPLGAGRNTSDTQVRFGVMLEEGENALTIEVSGDVGEPGSLLFFMLDWYVEAPMKREAALLPGVAKPPALPRRHVHASNFWPRISVVVPTRDQGRFIGETLESLLAQSYPDLEIVVVDAASCDYTRQVIAQYADHIAEFIRDGAVAPGEAVNTGMARVTGDILTWLDGGDRLAEGALFSVASAFLAENDVDVVAGICLIVDDTGPVSRHLPASPDGPLPLGCLLDIDDVRHQDGFFERPNVFVSRRLWQAAGARVQASLDGDGMVDLWARLAGQGAALRVIGSDLFVRRTHSGSMDDRPGLATPASWPVGDLGARSPFPPILPPNHPIGRAPMRILMFHNQGYRGGTGAALRGLATALSLAGHHVTCLSGADVDAGLPEREASLDDVMAAIVDHSPSLVLLGYQNAAYPACDDIIGRLAGLSLPTIVYAHDDAVTQGAWAERLSGAPASAGSGAAVNSTLARRSRVSPTTAAKHPPLALFTSTARLRDVVQRAVDPSIPVCDLRFGVNTGIFRPRSRSEARRVLDLPQDAFIALTLSTGEPDGEPGIGWVVQAFQHLRSDAKLLLVMGEGSLETAVGAPVRTTGLISDEALLALHCAAADVFVGASRIEVIGHALIQGAAVGTPSVACNHGGVNEAVTHERTGLLCSASAPGSLAHGLQRLHDDPALRRRLGAAATLLARTRHSLEACAWSFLTTLGGLPAFGVGGAPDIVLSAEDVPPPTLHHIAGQQAWRSADDGWEPGPGLRRERSGDVSLDLTPGYAKLGAPTSRVFLKAEMDGVQTLTVKGRNLIEGQRLTIRVNGVTTGEAGFDRADAARQIVTTARAEFVAGPNRVDLDFAVQSGTASARHSPVFLLESLRVGITDPAGGLAGPFSAWDPLNGFGELEGPYPKSGIHKAFRWIDRATARLRVRAEKAGSRRLKLVCRIHTIGQLVRLSINGAPAGDVAIEGWRFTDVVEVVVPVAVVRGWNIVTLQMTTLPDPGPDGRSHFMEFYAAEFMEPVDFGPVGVRRQSNAAEP